MKRKMAKKGSRHTQSSRYSANHVFHDKNIRAVIALLVLLLAFSILLLFNTYQTQILSSNLFAPFMTLTVLGMALLFGLLFLVTQRAHK